MLQRNCGRKVLRPYSCLVLSSFDVSAIFPVGNASN